MARRVALPLIVAVAGLFVGLILWLPRGRIVSTGGDCIGFSRCYTTGHPYAITAFLVVIGSLGLAIGLWLRASARHASESS
jgi:hypothetical protein